MFKLGVTGGVMVASGPVSSPSTVSWQILHVSPSVISRPIVLCCSQGVQLSANSMLVSSTSHSLGAGLAGELHKL